MQSAALFDGCQSAEYHIAPMVPIRHPIRGQTGFSRSCGVCGQSVSSPLLHSPPTPCTFLPSPQFLDGQKPKNASNVWKTLRQRLPRRLEHYKPGD